MSDTEEASFDELEAEMDALEEGGVPDEWIAAHKKLRSELKNKRERFSPIEQAFNGIADADREALMNIVATYGKDPVEGARLFAQASRAVAEATQTDWNELAGIQAATEEKPEEEATVEKSVEERVQELLDERLSARDKEAEEKAAIAKIQASIESKMKDLGYEDPSSPDAQLVLLRAKQIENADVLDAIQQSHDSFGEFITERSKTFVSQETADAGDQSTSDEGLAAEETSPADDGRTPDMKAMKASMQDRLGAIYDNSSLGDAAV